MISDGTSPWSTISLNDVYAFFNAPHYVSVRGISHKILNSSMVRRNLKLIVQKDNSMNNGTSSQGSSKMIYSL